MMGALPLSPPGGEVVQRSGDGLGKSQSRSRRNSGTTKRARTLRQGDNKAEASLWLDLKRSGLGGHKFTRQFPIGPYFADFCCRKQKLVVEVDGSQHAYSKSDRYRDEFMRAQGYSVLRLWSHDILQFRTDVCETILATLEGRLSEDVKAFDLRFVTAAGRLPQRSSPPAEVKAPLPLPPPGGEVAPRSGDGVGVPSVQRTLDQRVSTRPSTLQNRNAPS